MDQSANIFPYENLNSNNLDQSYFNNPDLIRRLPVHDEYLPASVPFVPYTLDEDPAVKRFIGSGVTFISLVAENLLSHPFLVLRRQCQVHHASQRYHLQPFTLIPVVWRLYQHQGLTTLWKGVGSVLLVRGMSVGIEDLISKLTPWPKEISWHSGLKQFFQHTMLKCASLAIVTPFYSASFVETVQSDIASEKPGILDVFKEGSMRLLHWGAPTNGRMVPIWALIVPTITLGLARYLLAIMVKGVTSRILLARTQARYEESGALPKDPSNTAAMQNNQLVASLVATIVSDVVLYPCETVIHRLHLQGTRTIVDNLDNGKSVLPILTNYCGAIDCYESCVANEGICGLYKGFGALIFQYAAHIALIKISHFMLTQIGSLLESNEPKPSVKVSQPLCLADLMRLLRDAVQLSLQNQHVSSQIKFAFRMTSIKNRERILEAIDQLRRRKARPDIQRICNYLFRRFAVNSVEAKSDLDWCVANNYVLKVEYKGSISYRNAAKKSAQMKQRDPNHKTKLANHKNQAGIPTNDGVSKLNRQFGELLTNAFGELIVEEPDYLEIGVPGTEIINSILSKDSVRYTKKYISILLEKEVKSGGLIKMDNGHYLMGPSRDEEDADEREKQKSDGWKSTKTETEIILPNGVKEDRDVANHNNRNGVDDYFNQVKPKKRSNPYTKKENYENMDSSTNSADEKKSVSDSGSLRIGGRRKRAKKVFDPSDIHVPKKRGRPIGSLNRSTIEKQQARGSNEETRPDSRTSNNGREQGGVCSVCHIQNKRGPNDRMVACTECSNKAHFSCLNGDDLMLKMNPDNTWQCPHCKFCVICYETSDAGNLMVCSECTDAYHPICQGPLRISDKKQKGNKWICLNCQLPDELEINEIQSNIGNSFSQKSSADTNDASSSNSGNSSPFNYNSPPVSPTPPHLSPQTGTRPPTPDNEGQSDSQSIKDEYEIDENIDTSIPDATHWSADEVYQYFAQYFPEEAKIFKEQEIDGRSLLLLKRMDVLTNLNLKLGPALKIYRHVVKLQVRRDDPKLYWL